MTDTERRVLAVICELWGIPEGDNGLETPLSAYGVDSLDVIQVAVELEDVFDISLPDEAMDEFAPRDARQRTVRDLVELVDKKLGEKE